MDKHELCALINRNGNTYKEALVLITDFMQTSTRYAIGYYDKWVEEGILKDAREEKRTRKYTKVKCKNG